MAVDGTPDPNASGGQGGNAPNWTTGLEGELLGHVQTAGWDKMKADEAARAAAKSHLEARKHIGVPEDRIIKLPGQGAKPEEWNPVWTKLGAPADKKEYDFAGIKFGDGTDLDDGFKTFLRDQAAGMHLSKNAATDFAKSVVKWMDDSEAGEAVIRTAKINEEKGKLAQSWGNRTELNLQLAKRAAELLGFSKEAIDAMEGQAGYATVMQNFLAAAPKLGEDIFIGGKGGGGNGVITREQALARKQALMSDKEWAGRLLAGGEKERQELEALAAIEVGGP